jgi:hypothetical protein
MYVGLFVWKCVCMYLCVYVCVWIGLCFLLFIDIEQIIY